MSILKIIVGIVVVLGIVFAAGPRVEIDTTIQPHEIPTDVDAYLAESEARFADVKPDTEKTIIWANPDLKDETPVSFVYLHGFSATRQESAPVSDQVAAQLGGNLFYTRLTGHGRSDDAMAEGSVNAWLKDTMEAIAIGETLGEEVVLIGASTSAALLTWLAANGHLSDDVSALVFISPNYGPASAASDALLWPWGKQIARLAEGQYRAWRPLNDRHAQFWTYRYPSEALLPMMGAVKLARDADLSALEQPVLVLYSEQDIVVDTTKTKTLFAEFGAATKELVAISTTSKWGHTLAGDILAPETVEPVVQEIVEFLIPVLDAPAQ